MGYFWQQAQKKAYNHFAWIPPFDLCKCGCGSEGYEIEDPTIDLDCDVPVCYQLMIEG